MNIIINGKKQDVSARSIADYVSNSRLDPKTLVVEHNGQVIVSDQWEEIRLREGDRLELLSFVGGG
ncbi:MAG: sulfur carrier protein ThiS [Desulfobacteraceae bacterium]|jgi:thiamine biosynthesis protein ThiS